jgi:hypothetical protein
MLFLGQPSKAERRRAHSTKKKRSDMSWRGEKEITLPSPHREEVGEEEFRGALCPQLRL